MWTFARYLPHLVGQYIRTGDKYWRNFLTLLDITDYLMAPSITEDEIAYVKLLIEDHHVRFTQLYPDKSVPPKLHYLSHSPRLLYKYTTMILLIFVCT